ncbi:MAG: TolC family protein [Chitinophagaceae bacterium]|nr:TolC family protein [Chitinophagaceae bacterium]
MGKARKILIAVLWSLGFLEVLQAQPALDRYIQLGLENNLVIQTRQVSLDKSMLALREARSYFLPSSYLDAQYTLAQGGRNISIPVGDLLNPVYQTLNQLTGTEKFPQVANVEEQLLPNNFYDLRIRTSVPVINPSLKANRHIKQQEVAIRENELQAYKRELVKDIKTAYYQYLMADRAIRIFESAMSVVEQNLRLNQSLLANGKSLPAYVSRAEAEVVSVRNQWQNARNEKEKARAYVNLLLNRELSDSVDIEDPGLASFMTDAINQGYDSIEGREELKSLQLARDIRGSQYKLNKSYQVPRVNAFLDLAAQDFNFKVKSSSFFYLGGVQMTMPIFAGNRNLYKIRESELDIRQSEISARQTRKELEMAAFTARSNAKNLYGNYLASIKEEDASTRYYTLIDRGYREGVNSFIEILDARNQLTRSQLQTALNKYRFLAAIADYERQTTTYAFNK